MAKLLKFFVFITILSIIVGTLTFLAIKQAKNLQRDPRVLMDRFYMLKDSNPDAAERALTIILRDHNNHRLALHELSQLYLKKQHYQQALPLIQHLHTLEPDNPQYSLQLANLLYKMGDWRNSQVLSQQLLHEPTVPTDIQNQTWVLMNNMASFIPSYTSSAIVSEPDLSTPVPFTDHSIVVQILHDYFYQLQKNDPKNALNLIKSLNILVADNSTLQLEAGYTLLQENRIEEAITYFSKAYLNTQRPQIALQLAYLYQKTGNLEASRQYFLAASLSKDIVIKTTALQGYRILTPLPDSTPPQTASPIALSKEQTLLNKFFILKKTNKNSAWALIQKITQRYPQNVMALKEAGYLAIDLNQSLAAIHYFTLAYNKSYEAELAMQLGYLHDKTSAMNKYLAYYYFKKATRATDTELALKAQNAMTNLAGLQTKWLPYPYFNEWFFDPFSQSRFGLTVRPLVARLGIEANHRWQPKAYIVFRQSDDNKSDSLGQIPQIYEDNVRIIGGGVQITPFSFLPMVAFFEAGGAYDLIDRDRNRWRSDFRGGLMYYNEFGEKPAYYDNLKWSLDYYSTLYGDSSYFSRYNNNIISTIKTHQGIRLMQYHSSMINLYLSGRVIEDTNRDFFNNIAEVGPGIGFIPSNRFRLELRYEHIKGAYLPAGGPTGTAVNPYGKYYTNNIVQLLVYAKI